MLVSKLMNSLNCTGKLHSPVLKDAGESSTNLFEEL